MYSPYSSDSFEEYKGGNTFLMAGENRGNGFTLWKNNGYSIYNLKGKYRFLSFTVAENINGWSNSKGGFSIYSDDSCVFSKDIALNSLPQYYKVDIENAYKLEFRGAWKEDNTLMGFADIKLYK